MTAALISLMLMTAPSQYHWMTPEVYLYTHYHAGVNHLSPALVRAVIHAESTGRPYAVSHCGAIGLLQVMPFHVKDPWLLFGVEYNIETGCRILGKYYRMAGGDVPLTLKYFNAGPRGRTWPKRYIAKIIKHMEDDV